MTRIVPVEQSVGLPLAHDITEIRPGEFKGAAFLRGHVVTEQDLDYLKRLGKNHLFVLETESNEIHEDDAARQIAEALCGEGVGWNGHPREGKLTLKATRDGLLKVTVKDLKQFNMLADVMCATVHNNTLVARGQTVAATRAIPLLIKKRRLERAAAIARRGGGVLRVIPLKRPRVGVMITGDEVFYGRIQDRFEPVIREKVESLGGSITDVIFLPDDDERISAAAIELVAEGAEILVTTGGMSVDPDDRTRFALEKAGARDLLYGTAVLPGAMFLVAYLREVPVLGIPACGIFARVTVFDLIYPRILAGERIIREHLAELGHGGLCLHCEPCQYPLCPFGKGS